MSASPVMPGERNPCKHDQEKRYHLIASSVNRLVVEWCSDCGALYHGSKWQSPRVRPTVSGKLALSADELQASANYKRALRASVDASRSYAACKTPAEADKLERERERTNLEVWATLRILQDTLKGDG